MLQDDRILMPPPSVLYKCGTLPFERALERGAIHLSFPPSQRAMPVSETRSAHVDEESYSKLALHGSFLSSSRIFTTESGHATEHCAAMASTSPNVETNFLGDWTSSSQSITQNVDTVPTYDAPIQTTVNISGKVTEDNSQSTHSAPTHSDTSTTRSRKRKLSFTSLGEFNPYIQMEIIRFRDIIGHSSVKARFEELILPMRLPRSLVNEILTGVRSMPTSILLFGPPGCGKTKLARALAGEIEAVFLPVAPSDVFSKYVGESETSVREIFAEAWIQANHVPSKTAVLFFDELDALAQSRGQGSGDGEAGMGCSRRVLAELLTQLSSLTDHQGHFDNRSSTGDEEGLSVGGHDNDDNDDEQTCSVEQGPRIIVVSATNRPQDLDPALMRRFGHQLYVGYPTAKDRRRIILRLMKGLSHSISKKDMEMIVLLTEGWSGSDIENVTRNAAMIPVRSCMREAAILRRRLAGRRQPGGAASSQADADAERLDPEAQAERAFESSLRSLRPVTLQDFQNAIEFAQHGACAQEDEWHYSSSDDDDEVLYS